MIDVYKIYTVDQKQRKSPDQRALYPQQIFRSPDHSQGSVIQNKPIKVKPVLDTDLYDNTHSLKLRRAQSDNFVLVRADSAENLNGVRRSGLRWMLEHLSTKYGNIQLGIFMISLYNSNLAGEKICSKRLVVVLKKKRAACMTLEQTILSSLVF